MNFPRRLVAPGAVVLGFVALWWLWSTWTWHHDHVSTDNAYARADVPLVTPRVPGVIVELPGEENQQVRRGDVLARLDRADYELKLRQAEAGLAQARSTVVQRRAAVLAAEGIARQAEVALDQARRDEARAAKLSARGASTTERLEGAESARAAAEAQFEAARRNVEQAKAVLGLPLDAPEDQAALVRQAVAARDEAALALSYTELRAPVDGIVAKRGAQVGQAVQPGQPLMMLVPLDQVYVEANFKESQLEHLRAGQAVVVESDLYPGREYAAHVASIAPGSGAAFALLPPENASGNWVKVVQRVPVRIVLDSPAPAEFPLRVGTSVTASVDIRSGNPGKDEGTRP